MSYPDTAILGGLLGMGRDPDDRLRTLRFTLGRDPSGGNRAELIQIFCRVELSMVTGRVACLKQRTAKERHVRTAIETMIAAGGEASAPDVMSQARALLDRIVNPPPPVVEDIDPARDHLTIAEQDVVLVQTGPRVELAGPKDRIFELLWAERAQRREGAQWVVFADSDRLHVSGLSSWFGLSLSVPLPVIARIQQTFEALGLEVEREMGRAVQLDLTPFARLSDDGLELLVPAALAGDPTRKRIVPRGETTPVARGYRMARPRPSLF